MTQAEIVQQLHKLRYEGKWSIRGLAKEVGMSPPNLANAYDGKMSIETQARLSAALKIVLNAPPKKSNAKQTSGKMKQRLIRFYNLNRWCEILEREVGIERVYKRGWCKKMSARELGFICIKLDFIAKRYLLDLFIEEVRKKKITLADCYPFGSWVRVLEEKSDSRRELIKKLLFRKERQK